MSEHSEPDGMKFNQAMEELRMILERVEEQEVDIDDLATELGRAAKLLEACRSKIKKAEVEVTQIVQQLEEDEPEAENDAAGSYSAEGDYGGSPTGGYGSGTGGSSDDDDIPF